MHPIQLVLNGFIFYSRKHFKRGVIPAYAGQTGLKTIVIPAKAVVRHLGIQAAFFAVVPVKAVARHLGIQSGRQTKNNTNQTPT
jgi:hypothetical protein